MLEITLPPQLTSALAAHSTIRYWLRKTFTCDRCASTIEAYAYAVQDYLRFCAPHKINYVTAAQADLLAYLADLKKRPVSKVVKGVVVHRTGLASATRRKYWTALQMYYRYLLEAGIRDTVPFAQHEQAPRNRHGNPRRGVVRVEKKLPWLPRQEEWHRFMTGMKEESLRNNLMVALSYECALRKNELCTLHVADIVGTTITLRALNTKMKNDRRCSQFSSSTRALLDHYLATRPQASGHGSEVLFVSESTQNRGQPISDATWRKVVDRVAARADLLRFTPHTLRRLSINHFADQGYSSTRVTRHAGHGNEESTKHYRQHMPEQLMVGLARVLTQTAITNPQ
ncbi:tyrosine-type recombinase/integrase (plasmid) [Hymenobacter tibetensis]|uniref:Tyrosine-type recombinase/integrase n=1 Tax=Hymenobacter tibetensis TaxID=497967 RepID=A0ABY4D4I3_9BACT|nr:tyrosine-type recombinase/integrase [Hymenobacter tibetensis]UOG77433.1 tyrosine-type recombinase/integrase [Hymenobacter tibetensis]